MSIKNIKLAPSILSADFSKLGEEEYLGDATQENSIKIIRQKINLIIIMFYFTL